MPKLLDQYLLEFGEDVKVDAFNIKDVQMRLPAIKHKWVGRYVRCKQEVIKLGRERETLKKTLIGQLQKEAAVRLTDYVAGKAIEVNSVLREHDERLEECGLILEFLDESKKTLTSMTWDIRNIVEIMKLETT